jgi:hypothetical protein
LTHVLHPLHTRGSSVASHMLHSNVKIKLGSKHVEYEQHMEVYSGKFRLPMQHGQSEMTSPRRGGLGWAGAGQSAKQKFVSVESTVLS